MASIFSATWDCFNPTLVRLRPTRPDVAAVDCHAFQSHAGSIEAFTQSLISGIRISFQSHAGSIEARTKSANSGGTSPVSIPRWFD